MMKTIEIKNLFGSVLFKHTEKLNTIKKTLEQAANARALLYGPCLQGADLRGAYLYGAHLRGADLRGADLQGAYLRGADLRGADLRGAYLLGADLRKADLQGADLQGADLRVAYLRGADLQGADLQGAKWGDIEINKMAVFSGLYKYEVWSVIDTSGIKWVRMGCYFRSLKEWENDFWNNETEFPNDGSEDSQMRLFAFEAAKKWFKYQKK